MTVEHSSHARYDLTYHVAFGTKYRKSVWHSPEAQAGVEAIFRDIAQHYDLEISTMAVLPDHVHFLLAAPPRIAPARAIQILKSLSTRRLFQQFPWPRQQYWGGEIWIAGYFIRSVGPGLTVEQITTYITEQSAEK